MLKKCVSLPIETDEKINEFMQLSRMKNYSQSITKLIEIGFESFKKKNTVLDIYQKLDHIDLQNRYIRFSHSRSENKQRRSGLQFV